MIFKGFAWIFRVFLKQLMNCYCFISLVMEYWKRVPDVWIIRNISMQNFLRVVCLIVCLFIFRFLEHKYSFNIKTYNICFFFFLSGFSFTNTDDSQDSRGREGTVFYSILPLLPAHEHSDIYLELCRWDDYHIFLNAPLVFTRLLLNEIYHLIELPFDWLMMWH